MTKKRFKVEFEEEVTYLCCMEIEAESKEEALKKFIKGDWDEEYNREEYSNNIDDHAVITELEE